MFVKRLPVLFFISCLSGSLYAKDIDVTKYGAKGDSTTLNSKAIQKAIDDCSSSGGGKVIFPAGRYLSGTIVLKDNVTLLLYKDAVILGSTNIEDYQNLDPFMDGLGTDVGWALLVAVEAKNIGIEGNGAIDGQGSKLKAAHILTDTRPEGERWGRRPFLLRIVRCNNVTVKGVTLYYAAAWTSHYFQCTKVNIEKVKIVSRGVAHNDGIDIDGCQEVKIRDCDIDSGDDALCFKTTSSTMACRNIKVSGMRLKSGHGAIKMGTESMAPFEDIKISDCYIYNTNNGGIKLLTVDGAHLRNVEISDITMVNVKTPILIRLGSRLSVFRKGKDVQQPTGTLDNVVIRNVKAQASDSAQLKPPSGILITGVPGHYITNLTLENIQIDLLGTGSAENARQSVPEAIDKYPEVKTFGPIIPAYGVWARHVKGLKLKNISFRLKNNDLRPALVCEDVKDIEVTGWNIPATTGAQAIVRLENVQSANISNNEVKGEASAFVRVEGESKAVQVSKNKTGNIKKISETVAVTVDQEDDLKNWPKGASPQEVGTRVAEHFVATPHTNFNRTTPPRTITYPETCTWYGSLVFANLNGNKKLVQQLAQRFDPLFGSRDTLIPKPDHVDLTVFGAVPLELYIQTKDPRYLAIGKNSADKQWAAPEGPRVKPESYTYYNKGLTWQTRMWIDDMFMITAVQAQAYRATNDTAYINRAAREMVVYLDSLQMPNGLFYHAPDVPFFWGRGNGWMAAGMSELLRSLPKNNPDRPRIMEGYKKMMGSLLQYQAEDGMWRQLIDDPASWPETSCTGMFTFAIITGVKEGWLDKKAYGPAARKGWLKLITYIDANNDIHEVCEGTNKKNDRQYYIDRKRNIGDLHGQAPVLWCAAALLRK